MSSIIAGTNTPRACKSSRIQQTSKHTENLNPNTPPSCSVKKSQKPKIPNPNPNSPQTKIRRRKFVVAKKKQKEIGDSGDGDSGSKDLNCNCKEKNRKCVCVAYRNLRKSQEEFFKNRVDEEEEEEEHEEEIPEIDRVVVEKPKEGDVGLGLIVKRSRERLREEVRESVTQIGSGKVQSLVKAFEKLLFEPESKDDDRKDEEKEEKGSGSSFCAEDLVLTSQNLGLDQRASVSSSWDGSRGRFDSA